MKMYSKKEQKHLKAIEIDKDCV